MRRKYSFHSPVVVLIMLFAVAAATPWPAVSQAAQAQDLPTPTDIVARHVEAIGGRAALAGHQSSHATGSLEVLGQGLVGTMSVYAAAPDKTVVVASFPAVEVESRTGYDGEVGWSTDSIMGERLLQGGELQQLIDEADYYSDLHEPDRFSSMETVGLVDFAGLSTYKLRLVYKSGREVFEYYDVETGRFAGTEGEQESLMGKMRVKTFVSDYQQHDDVLVATKIVQELGPGQSVQITIKSVEFDNVDPAMFALPAAIQALIR